jgi:hypothetical protein
MLANALTHGIQTSATNMSITLMRLSDTQMGYNTHPCKQKAPLNGAFLWLRLTAIGRRLLR